MPMMPANLLEKDELPFTRIEKSYQPKLSP